MKKIMLRTFSLLWLTIITPFFGILPMLMMLNVGTGEWYHIDNAVIATVYKLFFGDYASGVEDASPPLTVYQYWFMIIVVLGVAVWALYYCTIWFREAWQQRSTRMN